MPRMAGDGDVGSALSNTIESERSLGSDEMGKVHVAHYEAFRRPVTIKEALADRRLSS